MAKKISSYVIGVARTQYKGFLKILIYSYLVIFVGIRFLSIPHKAEVRMVTNIPTAESHIHKNASTENFTGGGPFSLDRQAFLASQEVLLTSLPLFEAVQKKAEADVSQVMSPGKHVSDYLFEAKRLFQTVLFGGEYTENLGLWKNPAYTRFVNRVSFTPIPQEGTFIIGYTDSDPITAMRIVGYISEALIDLNVKMAREESNGVATSLKERLEVAKADAEEASLELSNFLKEANLPADPASLRDRYNLYVSALREDDNSTRSKMRSEARLKETERFIKTLEDAVNRAVLTGVDVKVGHLLNELKRVQTAEPKTAEVKPTDSKSSDAANRVPAAEAVDPLEPIRQKLANEIAKHGTYAPLKDLLELLSKSKMDLARQKQALAEDNKYDEFTREMLAKYEAEIKRYPEFQARLTALVSESNQKQAMAEQLNQEYLKYSVKSESGVSRVFPIQKPTIVTGIMNPGKFAALFTLLALATMLVPVGVGLFHYFRKTIFSKSQLTRRSDSKFAGVFPHMPNLEKNQVAAFCATSEPVLKLAEETFNSFGRFHSFGGKVVALTGATSGSGSSLCSYGLAKGLHRLKQSVLVVDCEFLSVADENGVRPHGVSRLFNHIGLAGDPHLDLDGLVSKLESSTFPQEKNTLTVVKLLSGSIDQKVYIEILRENFVAQLQKLKKHYDFIVLDGPALTVAEGLMLIEQADAVLFCCPEGKISESELKVALHAVNQYRKDNSLLLTVLTDTKIPANKVVEENYGITTLRAA